MSNLNLGLSNPYLKLGVGLVLVSVAAIAWSSFVSADSSLEATTRYIGGVALLTGVVVYIIGRVVKARAAAEYSFKPNR